MNKGTQQQGGPNREWLLKMACGEDTCQSVSVGGMAEDLGMLTPQATDSQRVFGRLIEFARRSKNMSMEELAENADVELGEVFHIETRDASVPSVRTVYQLAQVLDLPSGGLTELAGLATPRRDITAAALRFAALSKPSAKLSDSERDAFEEFVKVLVEKTDRR